MSIQLNKPDAKKFFESVIRRQGDKAQSLEKLVTQLNLYYENLDKPARRAFVDSAVRMYANYENRWMGDVYNGMWRDQTTQGSNNVYFTVPLLTAHVDTHTTFYTKVRPKYLATPFVNSHLNRRVAEMCQDIGTKELARMLTPSKLQHEAQNIALATVSYRNIVMDYQPHSPVIMQEQEEQTEVPTDNYQCQDCGQQFQQEQETDTSAPATPPLTAGVSEEAQSPASPQCPTEGCMSDNTAYQSTDMVPQTVVTQNQVTLPRPEVRIPNPIAVQDDFGAATFHDTRFIITRRKMSVREAEFYYQIDLSSAYDNSGMEAEAQYRQERMPIGDQTSNKTWVPFDFPKYVEHQNLQVEEVKMWLEPCEYGLYFVESQLLSQKYPYGAFFHIVGDKLVTSRAADKNVEWIRVQQGVRPMSNKGMGMVHLADLNDAINNSISLDYSILRTHGFPIRLLRGRWLSALPQATQTLVMDKIPEDRSLQEAVHTEQASNTSGLLGVITQRFQGFMQYVGGSLNPSGMPADMKDMMGTATGASAIQEMMSDRMGLSIQMRCEADIDTIYAVLELLKNDTRNRQHFLDSGYDESIVDAFFKTDFRSLFYLEPVKGSDEPRLESTNTFKVQSFAQLTAALTGLRQYDENTFYDIVSALGDTLNIDVAIGAGRKERNLADNKITRIIELYKDEKNLPDALGMDANTFGMRLYQAVTMKEAMWMQSVVQAQLPPPQKGMKPKDLEMLQQMAQHISEQIEVYLYDYDALVETYSDWLQSDAGQNADIAVYIAVGLLYTQCRNMQDKKKALQQEEAMQQAMLATIGASKPPEAEPGDGKSEKGVTKRDGSDPHSAGRPRDIHVQKTPKD